MSGEIRYTATLDASSFRMGAQQLTMQTQQLGNSVQTATNEINQMPQALDNTAQAGKRLEQTNRSIGQSWKQSILGITTAVSGIIGLVQQYTSLQRAQNTLKRSMNLETSLRNKLIDLRNKEAAAIKKYGKNSEEVTKIVRDRELVEKKLGVVVEKNEIMQQSLNERMADFATNIIPNFIGVGSGIAQVILGHKQLAQGQSDVTGTSRIMNSTFLKLLGPIALIGGALVAIKFNIFGFRDAVNGIGAAIGDALPFLKPFLNFIKDVGVVFGLIPGDVDKAKKGIGSFVQGLKTWFGEVKDTVGKIWDRIANLDIAGAIDVVKESVNKAFPGVISSMEKFFKDPIGVALNLYASAVTWIGQRKWGKWTIEQWVAGLGVMFSEDLKKHGAIPAAINVIASLASVAIGPLNADIYKKIGLQFETEFKENPVQAGINLLTRIVDFTIVSLLPADYAKAYLKFTQEWDRSKGQNVAKVIVDVAVAGFGKVTIDTTTLGTFAQSVTNLLKASPPLSVSPIISLGALAVPNNAGDIIDKWVKDTFSLENFKATLTDFSLDVVDPFIAGMISTLTDPVAWQTAITTSAKTLTDIGGKIWGGIMGFFTSKDTKTGVSNAANTIKNMDWGAIGQGIIDGISGWFTTNLPQTTKIVTELAGAIHKSILKVPAELLAAGQELANSLFDSIVKGLMLIPDMAAKLGGAILGGLGGGIFKQQKTDSNGNIVKTAFDQDDKDKKDSGTFDSVVLDAIEARELIIKTFNNMASSISKINLAIAKSWGKVMNQNIVNTASGVTNIVSRFNKMASSISKINFAIAKSWSKTMNQNITNTSAAVKRIQKYLDSIKNKDVYVYTHHVDIFGKGGTLSFAKGGILKRAQTGLIETTTGPRMVLFGDNPGGRETHAFIPHNNPGPTMDRLEHMFGRAVNSKGNGPVIVNLSYRIDGNELINTRALRKTIKLTSGENRDRFG